MTLHDLEPLRPWAVLIGCVGFCIAGAIWVELTPLTNNGYRRGKPFKPGVYKTRTDKTEENNCFNYWDGEQWMTTGGSIVEALKHYGPSCHQSYWFKEV